MSSANSPLLQSLQPANNSSSGVPSPVTTASARRGPKPIDPEVKRQRKVARTKEWRRRNPFKSNSSRRARLASGDPAAWAAQLIANARLSSAKRNHPPPEIDREHLEAALSAGVCGVTGVPFVYGTPRHPLQPSLDRPDSTRPYTNDNFRVVAWAVNAACGEWGQDAYLALAARALGVSNQSTDAVIARLQEQP